MTTEISITRALAEIKTLDERIQKQIDGSIFVSLSKGRKDAMKPAMGKFVNVGEVNDTIKAGKQSVDDLIARRTALRRAVQIANVNTKLTVNGVSMTISEAIDLKHVIGYKRNLHAAMVRQLSVAANNVEQSRIRNDADVQSAIERLMGSDVKNKAAVEQNDALIESAKTALLDMHEVNLIDPLNIKAQIASLADEIDKVSAEIDFALSEVNASTKITIEV